MVKKTKDPVCGMNVDEKRALKLKYKNKNLFFCSVNCKKKFNSHPNYYLNKKRNNSIIELKSVWKIYRMGKTEVDALKDLNFKVRRGEFLAIKGSSGSGKSTMLHSIGCLDVPTKGSIHLEGKNISRLSESNLAQFRGKKIGYHVHIPDRIRNVGTNWRGNRSSNWHRYQ
jgi:ABC-type glutathione transport system ATPase component